PRFPLLPDPLSLHDALPIYRPHPNRLSIVLCNDTQTPIIASLLYKGAYTYACYNALPHTPIPYAIPIRICPSIGAYPITCISALDRKSTRLNSSHVSISYAV